MTDQQRYLRGSIDTHCHITSMIEKGLDALGLLAEIRSHGMAAVVDVGLTPDDLSDRETLLSDFPLVALTSGIHPSRADRDDLTALVDQLSDQVAAGRIVAVGELGLDYHWDTGERGVQQWLLDEQLALAAGSDLPVIIHNREADDDIRAALQRLRPRGVMHCFSQGLAFCRVCLDLGMYISFGGNLTYKRSEEIREAARFVPADRLLVETDSPYLSPLPVRGRPNHPGHLGFTIDALAELRGHDAQALAEQTAQNARALFERNSAEEGA